MHYGHSIGGVTLRRAGLEQEVVLIVGRLQGRIFGVILEIRHVENDRHKVSRGPWLEVIGHPDLTVAGVLDRGVLAEHVDAGPFGQGALCIREDVPHCSFLKIGFNVYFIQSVLYGELFWNVILYL